MPRLAYAVADAAAANDHGTSHLLLTVHPLVIPPSVHRYTRNCIASGVAQAETEEEEADFVRQRPPWRTTKKKRGAWTTNS